MGNLGLFETINTRVGEIAVEVAATPVAWNVRVFSLIWQLSETVILPIAGLILTFVAIYELIQLIIENDNLIQFYNYVLHHLSDISALTAGSHFFQFGYGFSRTLLKSRLLFRPFFIAEKKGYGAYTSLHSPF